MSSPPELSLDPDGRAGKPDTACKGPWGRFKDRLQWLFSLPLVELAVALFVLLSVVLTLTELALWDATGEQKVLRQRLSLLNDLMTYGMIGELSLRYLAAPVKRRFFREYWLDIISVLPLFRVFRAMRVLRLLRLLRLFGVATRLAWHFPDIIRRGALEYAVVCSLLLLTVVFGMGGLMFFEPATAQEESGFSLRQSFWFSVYSLFAGEPIPSTPQTFGGKLVAVFVMFMGLTIFAMFTGTISAFMVERLRTEERKVDWEQLSDHVVLCGWSTKGMIIIEELRVSAHGASTPIVIIAEQPPQSEVVREVVRMRNVFWMNDDFTRVSALEKAGIERAKTCIVLSDVGGGRSEQDADARTILAALTVEKLNPSVYTCAELLNETYASHLKMGNVNDYVVSGEYAAYLLAQATLSRGLLGVYGELLTYRHGNEMYRSAIPASWHGRSFEEMLQQLKADRDAILIAVVTTTGELYVNPSEHTFAAGEEVIAITRGELQL